MNKAQSLQVQNTVLLVAIIVRDLPLERLVATLATEEQDMRAMVKALRAFQATIPAKLPALPTGLLG